MSVHYVLDGYNVVRCANLGGRTLEEERKNLVQFLISRRPHGSPNNRVTILFDSRENSMFSAGERHGEIEVRFSRGRTADDAIVDFIEEHAHPRSLVLVTNDRGLRQRIQGTGARALGVAEFLREPPIQKFRERP